MSIGFNEETPEGSQSKFIDVTPEKSIAGGRFLNDISVSDAESGDCYLNVEIRDKDNKTANRRFYEPKIGGFVKNEDDLKKAQNKIVGIGANIVRRYKGEQASISGANWREFFNNIVTAVKNTSDWDKKEIRAKVVLNKDNFPTLPGYPPIFEDISIPTSESKLRLTEYDNVVKAPVRPDVDTTEEGTDKVDF